MKGSVYFVKCGWPDEKVRRLVKVGYARDVKRRLAILQTGNPFELHLLATLPDVPPKLERVYHAALDEFRVRGEWFYLCIPIANLIRYIAEGARPMDMQQIRHYLDLLTPDQQVAWKHIKERENRRRLDTQRKLATLQERKSSGSVRAS